MQTDTPPFSTALQCSGRGELGGTAMFSSGERRLRRSLTTFLLAFSDKDRFLGVADDCYLSAPAGGRLPELGLVLLALLRQPGATQIKNGPSHYEAGLHSYARFWFSALISSRI